MTRYSWIMMTGLAAVLLCGCGRDTANEDPHAGHDHAPGEHGDKADPRNSTAGDDASRRYSTDEWCFAHDVPEAECTRCHPELVDRFKEANDWCGGHGIPESQCLLCNPEFEVKWAAMRPEVPEPSLSEREAGIIVERRENAMRPENDPLCRVEDNQIRFLDPSIATKTGIRVEPATSRRITAEITCPAEVSYDETQLAHITPRTPGVIVDVRVDLGDAIEPGQVLAVIDSTTLGKTKSEYIEARESLLIAQADVERHNVIHEAIAEMLEACDARTPSEELRAKFDDVRIGEAKSRLLTTHARLELARQSHEREKSLSAKGISTQEALQNAASRLAEAEAEFAATHEAIDIAMEEEHLDLERALRVAQAARDAARRQLQIVGVGSAQIQALDNGEHDQLARYELRSPIAGQVVRLHAVVGEMAPAESALFSVADLSSMWLMLSLDERDLATVALGQPVQFAADGWSGRQFQGTIDWLSSEVDDRTRTVEARVTLPNSERRLRANMFGTARVLVRQNEAMLTVPEQAIQTDGCCSLVFVKHTDTLYRPRKVELGLTRRGFIEVLDGLTENEPVVTTGSFLLKTEILKGSIGAGCCEVDPGR